MAGIKVFGQISGKIRLLVNTSVWISMILSLEAILKHRNFSGADAFVSWLPIKLKCVVNKALLNLVKQVHFKSLSQIDISKISYIDSLFLKSLGIYHFNLLLL